MDLEQGITAFSEVLGAPPPGTDAAGRYVFRFEEDLELRCFLLAGKPILEGVVCMAPADTNEAEALLKSLLRVSLGRARERADVLMLDEETREVRLFRRLSPEAVKGREFVEAAEDFLNELDFWRRRASQGGRPERFSSPFSLLR